MYSKKIFIFVTLFIVFLSCSGCETTKGIAKGVAETGKGAATGIGKDIAGAGAAIVKADQWFRENLW